METIWPIAVFALATSCTPGPNNIMLTASGVNFGFVRSLPHMAGVSVGFLIVLAACAGGLGLLFAAFPVAHTILKVVGAVYMLWLAWKVANAGGPEDMKDAEATPLTFLQAGLPMGQSEGRAGRTQRGDAVRPAASSIDRYARHAGRVFAGDPLLGDAVDRFRDRRQPIAAQPASGANLQYRHGLVAGAEHCADGAVTRQKPVSHPGQLL